MLWGDDFSHEVASKSYDFLDNEIFKFNNFQSSFKLDYTFNLKYSSMQAYLDDVYNHVPNHQFEVVKGSDFWHYSWRLNDQGNFWTGYFSTYPEIKRAITSYSDYVHSVTQMWALYPGLKFESEGLMETLSVM